MNVVVSGPFGLGSLADEAALAGLLKHLSVNEHEVTVLSADQLATGEIHSVNAVKLASPSSLLSTPSAWVALKKAHLFVLASAGPLGAAGNTPARVWLAQLEHVKQTQLTTALIGAGALPIADSRERVRLQRYLHNFADGISLRDEGAKLTMIGYGLSANRISANGDLIFALDAPAVKAPEENLLGVIFSSEMPTRTTYGYEPHLMEAGFAGAARKLFAGLSAKHRLRIFTDNNETATSAARAAVKELGDDKYELVPADAPIAELQEKLSECQAVVSFGVPGIFLAAVSGTIPIGFADEAGAADWLARLGLASCVATIGGEIDGVVSQAVMNREALLKTMREKLAIAKKKEQQNFRMLERLVPQRDRFERENLEPAPRKRRDAESWNKEKRRAPARRF